MDGDPVLLNPEGTLRPMIALGSAGAICRDSTNPNQVVKAPLKHNVQGCNDQVIKSVEHREYFSELCISQEKLIYQTLPKNAYILDCLATTERGLLFPFMRLGNLRDYLQKHNHHLDSHLRDHWIENAVNAISIIHAHGVIHADISPRNFLVADDLSIKLCDFAGSAIGDLDALVEEEDRYRISPWSARTVKTDLFALGCLIFEISTGVRPYDEIADDRSEEIQRRYAEQIFPDLDGLRYRDVIYKCWTSQYTSVDMLIYDIEHSIKGNRGTRWAESLSLTGVGHYVESGLFPKPSITSTMAMVTISSIIIWLYRRQNWL